MLIHQSKTRFGSQLCRYNGIVVSNKDIQVELNLDLMSERLLQVLMMVCPTNLQVMLGIDVSSLQ